MNLRICWLVILTTSKPQFGGEKVKLGDVCTLVLGQSPISSTCNACGQGLPFFQGNADFGRINPEATSWCTEPKKIAEPGDILLSVRAPIGAVNIALEKCCIGRGVAAIRPNSRIIQTGYLKHVLVSYRSHLETKGTGSTFKAIGKKVLSEFEIPICSLNGQSQIENQLNQILDCIENCKMEIEQLDQLVKSRFVEMFDSIVDNPKCWQTLPLSIAAPVDYKAFPEEDRVWQLNLDAVESMSGSVFSKTYAEAAELKGSIGGFDSSQVLYSKLRPYLNKVVVPDSSGVCTTELLPLSPLENVVNKVYLATALRSSEFVTFASNHSSGAKMPRIDMKAFRSFELPIPPLKLQQEFADFVAQVDKSGFA